MKGERRERRGGPPPPELWWREVGKAALLARGRSWEGLVNTKQNLK